MTERYNQGKESMDVVLALSQRALYYDMSQFLKVHAGHAEALVPPEGSGETGVPGAVCEGG